jgi:ParB family transcriptional regulator, chromosome partitioning protein
MSKDRDLENSMRRHRSAQAVNAEMASTVFGQLAQESQAPIDVLVARVRPSPFQRRGAVDETHIENLMESIAEGGLVSPIVVRRVSDSDTRSGNGKVSDSDTPTGGAGLSDSDTFELVAGHNRTEAFRRLGRARIPAIVRVMSDSDAARALTVDNTLHKNLADWELYKHITMLRAGNFVKNVTDLASVMGCSRAAIYNLEAFGNLPKIGQDMLDAHPSAVGGTLAYDLKTFSESHPDLVTEAIGMLIDGKLKQSGVVGYVQRKVVKPMVPFRKEVTVRNAAQAVRIVMTESEARVSGDLDYDKLRALIEEHLSTLKKSDGAGGF